VDRADFAHHRDRTWVIEPTSSSYSENGLACDSRDWRIQCGYLIYVHYRDMGHAEMAQIFSESTFSPIGTTTVLVNEHWMARPFQTRNPGKDH
jgi:hypothetical protein